MISGYTPFFLSDKSHLPSTPTGLPTSLLASSERLPVQFSTRVPRTIFARAEELALGCASERQTRLARVTMTGMLVGMDPSSSGRVAIAAYENLPGCPHPMAVVRG